MYRPKQFKEDRRDVLVAAMNDIRFAAIVTASPSGLEVTHVPAMVHEDSDRIVLDTHIARANPHWKGLDEAMSTVAIFQGPQA